MPLPLPQSYIGSLCEMKTLDNNLLAIGKLIKIDYDALEVAAPDPDDNLRLFEYRTPVKLFVHNSKQEPQILVGLAYLSTNQFARFEEVVPLQNFERRGAFRVNSASRGRIYPLMMPEERAAFDKKLNAASPAEQEAILSKLYTEVRIVDVSLTGTRLALETKLSSGQRFSLDFVPLDRPMTLNIIVVRIIKMPDDSLQYGCSYLDITEKQSDMLCKDLFQLQRLEKNRRNNAAL